MAVLAAVTSADDGGAVETFAESVTSEQQEKKNNTLVKRERERERYSRGLYWEFGPSAWRHVCMTSFGKGKGKESNSKHLRAVGWWRLT